MKLYAAFVILATVLITLAQEDGRYRPTEAPSTTVNYRTFPTTTKVPVYKYNDPRYGWNNAGRVWPNEPRYDPRYDTTPRFDSRFNTPVAKPYAPRPFNDYRTIRLDEKVDAKGYRYVYETVGGIVAEEVGTFENIGLKQEGVRTQGYVQITDISGVTYRIDYQTDSKDAYVPRGEAPRTPPSIVKLLSLLETHK